MVLGEDSAANLAWRNRTSFSTWTARMPSSSRSPPVGNRTNPLDRETTGFQYCGRYPEEPLTSTEDTGEVRRQLSRAWRAVGVRLLEEGYDPGDVAETMLAVALTTWSG